VNIQIVSLNDVYLKKNTFFFYFCNPHFLKHSAVPLETVGGRFFLIELTVVSFIENAVPNMSLGNKNESECMVVKPPLSLLLASASVAFVQAKF
jgi:hypothetical protein